MKPPSSLTCLRMHLARACNGLARRRVELGVRRRLDERDAVGLGGFDAAPEPVEHRRLHQERGKVPVVERKRLAQRLERAFEILQLPPDDGEVEPEPDVAAIVRDRIEKHRLRGLHVSGRHGLHGGLVRAQGLVVHGAVSLRFCRSAFARVPELMTSDPTWQTQPQPQMHPPS